jgi:DnaJ-class molecular chaperone
MSHIRQTSMKRMYVEPRSRIPFDSDYGAYLGHPDDPRYVGPSECPECMGTKYDEHGDKCPFCNGQGTYWEDA